MGWTKDRLERVVQDRLGGVKLVVVSNREPYIHSYEVSVVESMFFCFGRLRWLEFVDTAEFGVSW